jgi:excisionase family DNA binding protein
MAQHNYLSREKMTRDNRILLAVPEVCDTLNISRSTCYQLIQAGHLKPVRIGKKGIRIHRAEVERFAAEGLGPSN